MIQRIRSKQEEKAAVRKRVEEDNDEQSHDSKRLKQETKGDCLDEGSNPNRRKHHETDVQEQPGRSPKARRTDTSTHSSSKGGDVSKGSEGTVAMQSRANFKENLMQRIQDQAEQASKRRKVQAEDEAKTQKEFRNKPRGSGAATGNKCAS